MATLPSMAGDFKTATLPIMAGALRLSDGGSLLLSYLRLTHGAHSRRFVVYKQARAELRRWPDQGGCQNGRGSCADMYLGGGVRGRFWHVVSSATSTNGPLAIRH